MHVNNVRDKGYFTRDRGRVSRTIKAMCKIEILKGLTINTRYKNKCASYDEGKTIFGKAFFMVGLITKNFK